MQVTHPLDRSYGFQVSVWGWRLLYFVPFKKLQAEVRSERIHPDILKDFPYGIEVSVDEQEYRYMKRVYRFEPPMAPELVQAAFHGIYLYANSLLAIAGQGWINAGLLERYAATLSQIVQGGQRRRRPRRERLQEREAPEPLEPRILSQQILVDHPPDDLNLETAWNEQRWGKVRMSAGLKPIELFDLIQQPKRRKKRGNRT